jgi:N-acylneuraminate cytidylyltransferase
LQYARLFTDDSHICISTNDPDIFPIAQSAGYEIPFVRPEHLATDEAGMYDVLIHALDEYEKRGSYYDSVVLLQPTSPFRRRFFLDEAAQLFNRDVDMVVAVNESKANPYFNLFEENEAGYLKISKASETASRQKAPAVYQYNGNFYIINVKSLRLYTSLALFPRIVKYVIPAEYGVDIDYIADWSYAEFLLSNHIVKIDGKL